MGCCASLDDVCDNSFPERAMRGKTMHMLTDYEDVTVAHVSEFQLWMTRHGGATTLEQQIDLARQLYNEAYGVEELNPPTTTQIINAMHQLTLSNDLVAWKGIRVEWFLKVFCKSPYVKKLRDFGCEVWFVRKVCIIEMIRRACHDQGEPRCGPLVDHLESVLPSPDGSPLPEDVLAAPSTFVSYTGKYTLDFFLRAMSRLGSNEYIWLDMFCVDQFLWTGKRRNNAMTESRHAFMGDLQDQIKTIQRTALVLEDWNRAMDTLRQIWVLWEVFCTVESNAMLKILIPKEQTQECSNLESTTVLKQLRSLDVSQAHATEDLDRDIIFEKMRIKGFHHVNEAVISALSSRTYHLHGITIPKLREHVSG